MKLYYAKGACSLAPHIIIHELNIPCELLAVSLANKKTANGEDYLAINPKGAVPALALDNGELLTENAVIQQYLADTHQASHLLPEIGNFSRYRVLEWLNFAATDLHKSFSPLFNKSVPADIVDTIFKPLLCKKIRFCKSTSNTPYLSHR